MQTIKQLDLSALPQNAQQELYDFYLFLKQRHDEKEHSVTPKAIRAGETALLSESTLAEDWNRKEEEEAWKTFQ